MSGGNIHDKVGITLFSEGNANMRELLGGKGANLAEMTNLVFRYLRDSQLPQKLVLSIMKMEDRLIDEIQTQINEYIVKMEEITG